MTKVMNGENFSRRSPFMVRGHREPQRKREDHRELACDGSVALCVTSVVLCVIQFR